MVTISDVAKRAGVSAASVSRHMSGGTVGGADRIDAAIKELRYRPNQSARGLRSGRHGCVGVIVPDITNPLFAALVNGIESALAGDDIRVLLANSNEDPAREVALVADLASRTDGLILIPPVETDPVLDEPALSGVPVVLVDRALTTGTDVDFVLVDNRQGARLAAEHLMSLGHKEIAVISGPLTSTPGRQRHEAFLQTLADAGQPVRPEHVRLSDFRAEGGHSAMASLLDDTATSPTAVFTANNLMTIGAMRLLKERGRVDPGPDVPRRLRRPRPERAARPPADRHRPGHLRPGRECRRDAAGPARHPGPRAAAPHPPGRAHRPGLDQLATTPTTCPQAVTPSVVALTTDRPHPAARSAPHPPQQEPS